MMELGVDGCQPGGRGEQEIGAPSLPSTVGSHEKCILSIDDLR